MTKERKEQKNIWDVECLYKSFDTWNQERESWEKKAQDQWKECNQYKGQFSQGAEVVKKCLDSFFTCVRGLEKLYTYAHLRHDENLAEDTAKAAFAQSIGLFQDFQSSLSWLEPEILALDEKTWEQYKKSPELESYQFYLQKIYDQKEHILPEEQEELLSWGERVSMVPQQAFSAINNVDFVFDDVQDSEGKKHKLTLGNYATHMKSKDRVLRQNTFLSLHGKYRDFQNTLLELLSGQVQVHIFSQKTRKYESCVQAALDKHKIPTSVYQKLVETTKENIHELHAYNDLRKKALGYEELNPWDMSAPLVENFDKEYSYQEAVDIVIDSVSLLGEEYQNQLKKGLTEQKWVDPFENKGKRSGAYSSGCYDSHPYILMNYDKTLQDVLTLSHEAGHSMHSYYSNKHQSFQNASYAIFVAEVASTFNEQLTYEMLLDRAQSQKERLYILDQQITGLRNTFFRQVLFAEFEWKIHAMAEQKIPLTPALLQKEYQELNAFYFGPTVKNIDKMSCEFLRIPHFYYNFYVYQYATGIAAATSLVDIVKQGGQKQYLQFLSAGASKYPVQILQDAGVDMTTECAVKALIKLFQDLRIKFEKELLKKS